MAPSRRSTSLRAAWPIRFTIEPPRPTMMPFCPSRSTRIVHETLACPSLAQRISSQLTATECGTSSRQLSSTFSRTNSLTRSSSVASESMSSGNHLGPSGRRSATSRSKASTLKPSVALVTITSSKRASLLAASTWPLTWSGLARSAFVSTRILGARAWSTCAPTHSSPAPTGLVTSTSIATTSTSESSASAARLSSLPRASLGLWRPGVSTMTIWQPGAFTTARMRLRVVCATGVAMARRLPQQALSSVDLPALGLPTRATNPLRKGVSVMGCSRSCVSM